MSADESAPESETPTPAEVNHKASRKSQAGGFSHGSGPLAEDVNCVMKYGSRLLESHTFEHAMGLVIGVNFIVVVVETDTNAKGLDTPAWVYFTSWGLLITFIIELLLKLYVLRRQFWHESWNVFDFFVISVDTVMSVLDVFNINFVNVSMLRILRLSRLARAAKVLRVFPELHLMLAGLAGAVQAIFWGTVLLCVALLVWSVIAVQFIHPLNLEVHEKSPDIYKDCDRCPHAYESVFQASLTFCTQIVAGDSWGRETVPIIEYAPISAFFFLGVFVSVGLAILNLILGVVVNVATEARDGLLKEMADEKLLMRLESHNQLLKMCQDMDEDGNDELTFEELRAGFDINEEFRNTLGLMDIGREDLAIVWTILDDDRSGTVTSKEFVSQVYKLKASDTQFMLAYIKYYITEIKDKLRENFAHLKESMDTGMSALEKDMQQIDKDVLREATDDFVMPSYVEECDCGNKFMGDALFCRKCGSRRKDVCECGNIFMDDARFCRKCGAGRKTNTVIEALQAPAPNLPAQESTPSAPRVAPPQAQAQSPGGVGVPKELFSKKEREPSPTQAVQTSPMLAPQPEPILAPAQQDLFAFASQMQAMKEAMASQFQPSPPFAGPTPGVLLGNTSTINSIDALFQKDSLEDLLEKVNLIEPESPPVNVHGRAITEPEVVDQLESVWQQCIDSIDDMRGFHSNLANLLESMIRRVSMSIAKTVSASVKASASKARPFSLAYRTTEAQLMFEGFRKDDEAYRDHQRREEEPRQITFAADTIPPNPVVEESQALTSSTDLAI